MRTLYWLLPTCVLFWACATKPMPSVEPVLVSQDRVLARFIAMKKYSEAKAMADSLLASRDQAVGEIAIYWKSIAWLYLDRPDSAIALLEQYRGKWTGGVRRVHSEAFLWLAKEASEARLAARQSQQEFQSKSSLTQPLLERVEVLHKETVALRAEIERLETERSKYQKLLKDLEKVR